MNKWGEIMKSHDQVTELLIPFVLGHLSEKQVSQITRHLLECEQCSGEVKRLAKILESARQTQGLAADEQLSKSAKETILAAAREVEKAAPRPTISTQTVWRIITKSRIPRLAAAAAIVIGCLIAISTLDGTDAWAQIVQALTEVENAHIDYSHTVPGGQIKRQQYWIRRPSYYRETLPNGDIIIDNGLERLTIYTSKKTAQLSESWQPFHPLVEEAIFEFVHFLRDPRVRDKFRPEIEITKLSSESDDRTTVYKVENWDGREPIEGKIWVDADTMLPQRIYVVLDMRDYHPDFETSIECKFNYEQMPDEFFSTAIPEGFTELPRIEPFVLSGTVVDEQGQAVEGAVVSGKCQHSHPVLQDVTHHDGTFAIRPVSKKDRIELPIFLRAFRPDDPYRAAWTLLGDPRDSRKEQFGAAIPGDSGKVEIVVDSRSGARVCAGAGGIVMQMEPAAKIAGMVTDGMGNPVADVTIHLRCRPSDKEGHPISGLMLNLGTSRTDPNGRYVLANLPPLWDKCHFWLHFRKEGYWLEARSFTSDGPLESQTIDFKMFKNDVIVTGRVVDNRGTPLVGYRILLCAENGKRRYEGGITHAQGYFRLDNCPAASDLTLKLRAMYKEEWEFDRKKYAITGDDEFVYYPETSVTVGYQPTNKEYYVGIVPEKPDIAFEVVLKNIEGEPIRYFSVGVQGQGISHEWRLNKLTQLTDADGRCLISEVPCVEDLKLRLNSTLSEEEQDWLTPEERNIAGTNRRYKSMRVPVEIVPGKKEYRIEVTVLTEEQRKRQHRGG